MKIKLDWKEKIRQKDRYILMRHKVGRYQNSSGNWRYRFDVAPLSGLQKTKADARLIEGERKSAIVFHNEGSGY